MRTGLMCSKKKLMLVCVKKKSRVTNHPDNVLGGSQGGRGIGAATPKWQSPSGSKMGRKLIF